MLERNNRKVITKSSLKNSKSTMSEIVLKIVDGSRVPRSPGNFPV